MTTMPLKGFVPHAVRHVAALTFLEFARRKDAYVVAIFMGLFALGTIVTRITGIESAAVARLLMSSGLALSHLLAAILMAAFCGRIFPEEFEQRTLQTLLAKPVSRGQVFFGRIGTSILLVWAAYLIFIVLTLLTAPRVEGQDLITLLEVLLLRMAGLAMLGLLVATLSLYVNAIVAVLISLLWYFGTSFSLNLLRDILETWPMIEKILMSLALALPDPALLSHDDAFTFDGPGLPPVFVLALMLYAVGWCLLFMVWARARFERIRL